MTAPRTFIGVDAGTSACKAVVVDRRRNLLCTAWRPYSTTHSPDGAATQDAGDWERALMETVRECADAVGGRTVAGLSVTAPAHNVVLLDRAGEPVAPVMLWSDTRPAAIAAELLETLGPGFFERTFVRLASGWTLPQLAWIQGERPGLWRRVRAVMPAKDYLRWRLTGVAATDPSDAAGTAMFDQIERRWMPEALAVIGIDEGQLPPLLPSASAGGMVTRRWAALTGLTQGTPVAVGATDTAAELLAVDATEPGAALVKVASTGTVVAVSNAPRPDPHLLTYPHAIDDRWYTLAATNSAATAFSWLRNTLFELESTEPERLYERMSAVAGDVGPGSDGLLFLPFLDGERTPHWDPDLRGAFLGLSSIHGRPQLCRAVLEGVGLSLRSCRDLLRERGLPTSHPRLGGGGMASRVWREIVVTMLDEPATFPRPQGPAIGAAMLAAAAIDDTAPLEPAAGADTAEVEVRPEWSETYDRLYRIYSRACAAVGELSHELVALPGSPAPSITTST